MIALGLAGLFQKSWFQEWVFAQVLTRNWVRTGEPPAEPRTPYLPKNPEPDARTVARAADLFLPDRIWTVHLHFSSDQWSAIQPKSIPRSRGWLRPDGTVLLANTNAPRPGLAGVFGVAQPWSSTDLDFGSQALSNVAVRFKGNGTFLFAENPYSRPFKVDLAKRPPPRSFAGQSEINLHNLTADRSFLHDTLGYEFFRDAGVPAPHTTYARLFLSIDGRWSRRLLGLYVVVEDPSDPWLADALGAPGGSLFKPVTLELFQDLGDDWAAYERIYNPKSIVSEPHRRRLIELSRLVTRSDDAEFARRIFDIVDLGHLCRFLACETLLSNYDGIFTNGQNFLLWIDPAGDRFGFSPWDLDQSWGGFDQIGTREERERADIFHPWVGQHRFFERVFALPEFQTRYRAELRRLLDTVFVPERLHRRIDALAEAIRPAVVGLPDPRPAQFEKAIADEPATPATASGPERQGGDRVHRLKPFVTRRAASVRDQLDGRASGMQIARKPRGTE